MSLWQRYRVVAGAALARIAVQISQAHWQDQTSYTCNYIWLHQKYLQPWHVAVQIPQSDWQDQNFIVEGVPPTSGTISLRS